MHKKFEHSIDDQIDGYIPFNTDAPIGAKIEMKIDEKGNFWLSANQEGCLHLARIFAELGLGNFPSGYHFHKNDRFMHSLDNRGPEFTFALSVK
jgi:hypothetical protein